MLAAVVCRAVPCRIARTHQLLVVGPEERLRLRQACAHQLDRPLAAPLVCSSASAVISVVGVIVLLLLLATLMLLLGGVGLLHERHGLHVQATDRRHARAWRVGRRRRRRLRVGVREEWQPARERQRGHQDGGGRLASRHESVSRQRRLGGAAVHGKSD